jgi:hypothetical protein
MRKIAAAVVFIILGAFALATPAPVRPRPAVYFSLEEARRELRGPLLLVFFATDCPVCFEDLFEARRLAESRDWPVEVVGVNGGSREGLLEFLDKWRWDRPVILDRKKELFRRLQVDLVPFKAVLVGEDVIYRDGPLARPEARYEELVKCLSAFFGR